MIIFAAVFYTKGFIYYFSKGGNYEKIVFYGSICHRVVVLAECRGLYWHLTNLNNYTNLFAGPIYTREVGDLTLTAFGGGGGLHGIPHPQQLRYSSGNTVLRGAEGARHTECHAMDGGYRYCQPPHLLSHHAQQLH